MVHILEFSRGSKGTRITFLVRKIEILLLQAPEVKRCSAKEKHAYMLLFDDH